MSTAMMLRKNGLAKPNRTVTDLATRIQRATATRNERYARADADYFDAIKRAVAEAEAPTNPEPAETVQ